MAKNLMVKEELEQRTGSSTSDRQILKGGWKDVVESRTSCLFEGNITCTFWYFF